MTELHPDTLRLRWLAANPHTVRWYPDRRKWGALQHFSPTVSEANASMSFRVLDSLEEALNWAMGHARQPSTAPISGYPNDASALPAFLSGTVHSSPPTVFSQHPLMAGDASVPRHPAFSTSPIFIDNFWWWRTPPLVVGSYITVGWLGAAKVSVRVSLEFRDNADGYQLHFDPPFSSTPLPLSHVADSLLWRPESA